MLGSPGRKLEILSRLPGHGACASFGTSTRTGAGHPRLGLDEWGNQWTATGGRGMLCRETPAGVTSHFEWETSTRASESAAGSGFLSAMTDKWWPCTVTVCNEVITWVLWGKNMKPPSVSFPQKLHPDLPILIQVSWLYTSSFVFVVVILLWKPYLGPIYVCSLPSSTWQQLYLRACPLQGHTECS